MNTPTKTPKPLTAIGVPPTSTSPAQPALLRKLPEVLRHYPVSRAKWYQGVKEGIYPQPVKLGPRAVAWKSSAVLALIG